MKYTGLLILLIVSCVQAQDLQKLAIKSKDPGALRYSPDNQFFALADGSTIELYNAGNDTRIKDFSGTFNKIKVGHQRDILDISFSNNGTMMATGSGDR